ncbi:hypothetical protein ACTFIN_01715 [Clostridium cagae]|uniref:hypothetical protein n=1 Tax=Clostridium TaxID=1485 RepID=UPI0013FC5A40|nr:hypothetical protein [Clostridium botulinum]MBN1076994.1 hypothetical protein [Clostridium botulinum]MBY6915601.1 hypothetical protein [Clostridium botulinum]NFO39872.1 hypothetical protein [Clostridium botulinum]NFQ39830.1 hypothetical protein [Clostridium botulinum]NFR85703.1 hypothetical protein [Clostridium botulinum]
MSYKIGHLSSTESRKCIICGKRTGNYVDVFDYVGNHKRNTSITIPACDGECREKVVDRKDILIGYAKNMNSLFKNK